VVSPDHNLAQEAHRHELEPDDHQQNGQEEEGMNHILVLSVLGFLALAAGVLIWVFFHQGGCCVKKALTKPAKSCPITPAS
jgi:flagellar basal body-associated protein FliL